MIGKTYGRLTVLGEDPKRNKNNHILYNCKCSCGKSKKILGSSIRSGASKSCGCLQKESITKHGMDRTPEYKAYQSMHQRCYNKKSKQYKGWGGRGIDVCSEWHDFNKFYEDMGDRPEKHTLERLDNEKGYGPDNCIWATPKEQALNRRNSIKVMHHGKEITVKEFASSIGLTESGARKRLKKKGETFNGNQKNGRR